MFLTCVDEHVLSAKDHLCDTYVNSRFNSSADEWPPYHPKHYTTLALICHKGRNTNTKVISQKLAREEKIFTELASEGKIFTELASEEKIFTKSHSKFQTTEDNKNFTIDVSELFSQVSSNSSFILIEGAPGIGKTVLSKEITYLWAVKKLFTLKKLVFLLYLRDPNIKKIHLVEDLAQHMVRHRKLASRLGEYLFNTKGKDLVVILDGYDEMPEEDRKNSFIALIIKREALSQCDLVVTSRPTASEHLRDQADCRVEVLGFTEENRLDYIKYALQESNDKIDVLQSYMQSNPTINALCYIPLNMTILLCLFEGEGKMESANTSTQSDCTQRLGNLPSTQTEMYKKFVLMTINRSIKREKQSSSDLLPKDLSNLPKPYNKIFEDLCLLAFSALKFDKIVLEFDKINSIFPTLTTTTENWSGLGLLKAVKFEDTVSFHFLHFSIQEYLAAYHIASLSNSAQITLLKETFWEIRYFNTWIMYVGITGGEQFAWKHFMSGNWFQLSTWLFGTSKISKKLLSDKIRCLHLFQCYAEIGGHEEIKKLFDGHVIDLSNQTLLPKDINILGFFLMRSNNKQWKILDLSNCNIGDVGCNILHRQFCDKSTRCMVNIEEVNFSHNQLHVPSILGLMDVFQAWHVSQAIIDDDNAYNYQFKTFITKFLNCVNGTTSQIISVGPYLFANKTKQKNVCHYFKKSTTFKALYLKSCHWEISKSDMQELSTVLLKQNLYELHIVGNAFPEYIMIDIVSNASSVFVCDYILPDEYLDNIAGVLKWTSSTCNWLLIGCNKVLGRIQHTCSVQLSIIALLPRLLINIRKVPLNSPAFSSKVLCKLELILYNSKCVFQGLVDLWHSHDVAGSTSTCLVENDVLIASKVSYYDLGKVLTSLKFLAFIFISNCTIGAYEIADLIGEQELLSFLYITDCHLALQFVNKICTRYLTGKSQLKELFIHTTNLVFSLTSDILVLLSNYQSTSTVLVTKDTFACQNPTDLQISLALQLETKISVWKFCNCYLNYKTYHHVVSVLAANVVNLSIFGCNLGRCELEVFNACFNQSHCVLHLKTLKISFSKINNTALILGSTLALTNKLDELDLRSNNLQTADIIDILKGTTKISTLKVFNVSHNNITDAAANSIAVLLSNNNNLNTVDLSYNSFQAAGAVEILKGMQNLSNLRRLNISNNNITDEAAADITAVLICNTKLEEIDLRHNKLHVKSAVAILKRSVNVLAAANYNIGFNTITGQAADEIITALSQGTQTNASIESFTAIGNPSNLVNIAVCINHGSASQAGKRVAVIVSGDIISDLHHNCLHITKVLRVLKENTNVSYLTRICITNSSISDEAADDLSVVLSRNNKLQQLVLSHNNLQTLKTTTIVGGMGKMSNLTLINVRHNNLCLKAAKHIATVLSHNSKLEELNLSCNKMQTAGVIKILCGITRISNLKKLNVNDNNITDAAAQYIGAVLSRNTKLEELDLSCNSLQAAGAIKLFDGMKEIVTLKRLSISKNSITDEVIDYLVPILCRNTKLEEIDLSYNKLQVAGIVKVLNWLKDISTLKLVKVANHYITEEVANDIAALLSHNNKRITDEAVSGITTVLCCNNELVEINLIEIKISIAILVLKGASTLIKRFSMNNSCISYKTAKDIAIILSCNTKLEELELSCIQLQIASAIEVFNGIRQNSNLLRFKIKNSGIADEVAKYIAAIFVHNTKLEELDLSYNRLQSAGAIKIFSGMKRIVTLKRLNISNNSISEHAADHLVEEVLSHNVELEELDLSCNNLQAAGAMKVSKGMKQLTKLRRFRMSNNEITPEAAKDIAKALSYSTKLEELDLSGNCLQNLGALDVLNGMKNISTLKALRMSNNSITDDIAGDVVAVMSNYVALEEVDLSYNRLQTTAVNILKLWGETNKIFTMKNLNLSHNIITGQVADEVTSTLRNMILEQNMINLQMKGRLEIFSVLESPSSLVNITASSNFSTSNVGMVIIPFGMSDLSYNNLKIADILKHFRGIDTATNFTKIYISHCPITDEAANDLAVGLSYSIKLEHLVICHNNIQSADAIIIFQGIENLSSLTHINITHNNISSEAADYLAVVLSHNFKLKELILNHNKLPTAGAIKIFQGMKNLSNLTHISVGNNCIFHPAANHIARVICNNSKLQILDISFNVCIEASLILQGIVKSLSLMTSALIHLDIGGTNFEDYEAFHLAKLFLCYPKLEVVYLHSNNLHSPGMSEIFQGMKNMLNLKCLDISKNLITHESGDCIGNVLSHNHNLQELNFSHNNLENKGIKEIFQGLTSVSCLTKLDISRTNINNGAADAIAAVLSHNNNLQEFYLSSNILHPEGVIKIFNGMQNILSLTKLVVGHNNITDGAADSIASVLSRNCNLQWLYLDKTNMKLEGISIIAKAIKHIPVKLLDIRKNRITCHEADVIAGLVHSNTHLKFTST